MVGLASTLKSTLGAINSTAAATPTAHLTVLEAGRLGIVPHLLDVGPLFLVSGERPEEPDNRCLLCQKRLKSAQILTTPG
jgi:hypothetical protein